MPVVVAPATILCTGASGFVGSWIARSLLEAGYCVRAPVRSQAKGEYLSSLFKKFGNKFEFVVVADITKPKAFNACLDKDIQGVVHAASAASYAFEDPADIIGPAVNGTLHLLEGILEKCENVKRVIYLSSAHAMLGKPLTHIYTEDDWNDSAVSLVKEKGREADGVSKYAASKVLAERAALDFVAKHKNEITWDLTTFVPGYIFGPVIHEVKTLEDLNLSCRLLYDHATKDTPDVNAYGSEYLDVRDFVAAVIASFETPSAGGERFILDAGCYTYQNLYDAINSVGTPLPGVPTGDTSSKFSFPGPFCNSDKAKRILNVKYRSLSETARDTLISLRAKGL